MNDAANSYLFQFFAGYFHEDWMSDANTPEAVVASFIKDHSPSERQKLADLIDELALSKDEAALSKSLFEEMGCYYAPADGNARSWLERMSLQLRAT